LFPFAVQNNAYCVAQARLPCRKTNISGGLRRAAIGSLIAFGMSESPALTYLDTIRSAQ
jgi:hypothetical protein